MTGYKQVSLTPEAHRALKQMKWAFSDTVGEEVTLSQVVLISQKIYAQEADDDAVRRCASQVGIEP